MKKKKSKQSWLCFFSKKLVMFKQPINN